MISKRTRLLSMCIAVIIAVMLFAGPDAARAESDGGNGDVDWELVVEAGWDDSCRGNGYFANPYLMYSRNYYFGNGWLYSGDYYAGIKYGVWWRGTIAKGIKTGVYGILELMDPQNYPEYDGVDVLYNYDQYMKAFGSEPPWPPTEPPFSQYPVETSAPYPESSPSPTPGVYPELSPSPAPEQEPALPPLQEPPLEGIEIPLFESYPTPTPAPEPKADKSQLLILLNITKNMYNNLSGYMTQDSRKSISDAYYAAARVYNDSSAIQPRVDLACLNLEYAIFTIKLNSETPADKQIDLLKDLIGLKIPKLGAVFTTLDIADFLTSVYKAQKSHIPGKQNPEIGNVVEKAVEISGPSVITHPIAKKVKENMEWIKDQANRNKEAMKNWEKNQ